MPRPTPTVSPSCPICGRTLADGPTIPTTSGGAVHIHCAEQQARATAWRRAVRAVISAAVLLGVGAWGLSAESGGLSAEGGAMRAMVLAVLLIAAHVALNRRWWGYTVQSARRWLGLRA